MLDDIATDFQMEYPEFNTTSTREQALTLNRWLRARNLVGMDNPVTNYRRLRNCFIGQALRHAPHPSLPLISSVIYSSVAGRLGLDAQPCLFPSHVHALVTPPRGHSLDGEALPRDHPAADGMHLDPYGNDDEIPRSTLQTILSGYGWQTNADLFLSPASPGNLAMRTAHNIRAAFRSDLSAPLIPEPYLPPTHASPASGASVTTRDAAVQAYLWSRLMLLPPHDMEWVQTLHLLTGRFSNSWLGDVWLVERYLVPMYDAAGPDGQAWDDPRVLVRDRRQMDDAQPLAKGRTGRGEIKYRVGQVVRHRRLDFVAVVTGWSDDGLAMGVEGQLVDGEEMYTAPLLYSCM